MSDAVMRRNDVSLGVMGDVAGWPRPRARASTTTAQEHLDAIAAVMRGRAASIEDDHVCATRPRRLAG